MEVEDWSTRCCSGLADDLYFAFKALCWATQGEQYDTDPS